VRSDAQAPKTLKDVTAAKIAQYLRRIQILHPMPRE
jgi:hypothetical protein